MTTPATCSALMPANAAAHLPADHVSVTPASFCARSSPTQTMGVRPCASAALIFLLTLSSVSPKYCRRSEWPMMT